MRQKVIMLTVVIFFGMLFFSKISCKEKIKLYILCTPSHQALKDDFFLPSLCDDFEIICEQAEQTCSSGAFMKKGWTKTTIKKVDLIIRAIHENWGTFFIFSDVDIQFFQPIENMIISFLKHNDLVIQKNNPEGVLCTGFFACKGNQATLDLWTDVKKKMEQNGTQSDQISLNQCIKRHSKKNPYNLTWDYLPDIFFGGGTLTGYEWTPGKKLVIPQGIVMHHANWTKGISNKIAQLLYVKNVVLKQQNNLKGRTNPCMFKK